MSKNERYCLTVTPDVDNVPYTIEGVRSYICQVLEARNILWKADIVRQPMTKGANRTFTGLDGIYSLTRVV